MMRGKGERVRVLSEGSKGEGRILIQTEPVYKTNGSHGSKFKFEKIFAVDILLKKCSNQNGDDVKSMELIFCCLL